MSKDFFFFFLIYYSWSQVTYHFSFIIFLYFLPLIAFIFLAGEAVTTVIKAFALIQSCAAVPSKPLYMCIIPIHRQQHFLNIDALTVKITACAAPVFLH